MLMNHIVKLSIISLSFKMYQIEVHQKQKLTGFCMHEGIDRYTRLPYLDMTNFSVEGFINIDHI